MCIHFDRSTIFGLLICAVYLIFVPYSFPAKPLNILSIHLTRRSPTNELLYEKSFLT